MLTTSSGVDGYVAEVNGANAKKLFSLPFSQILISWPSLTTLLAQTKSAGGVPGVAFSIAVKTGTINPFLYASGLSATANSFFSKVIYQKIESINGIRETYAHDTSTGEDISLPFNPLPEKCTWSATSATILYCAAPLQYTDATYLARWHQGLASEADSIFIFNIFSGITSLVVTPGNGNNAPQGPIEHLGVSPDGKYLYFITRGDQSLWGVRL